MTEFTNSEEAELLSINVVLVGDPRCGKKSIIQAFSQQWPSDKLEPCTVKNNQHQVEFNIWNTAGKSYM